MVHSIVLCFSILNKFFAMTSIKESTLHTCKKTLIQGVFLFLLFPSSTAYSQAPFQELNLNYCYNTNSEFMFYHRVSFEGNPNRIADLFFSISLNMPLSAPFDSVYSISAAFKKDYKSGEALTTQALPPGDILTGNTEYDYHFKYKVNNLQNADLMEISVRNKLTGKEYLFDVNLSEDREYGDDGLVLYHADSDLPHLGHFIQIQDPVVVKHKNGEDDQLWAYYYDSDFDVAVPPMVVDYKGSSRSLEVKELIPFTTDSVMTFTKPGLYFIQRDTSSLKGIGFRVEEAPFPKMGSHENLVKPLRYISTREESDKFRSSLDLRRTFQRFWIEKNDSESSARQTIRNFYNGVAEANFLFTGYKEGWKTDMGMIYIIYGPPSKVIRHDDYEEWIYNQSINLPALRFTFVKIKNVFSGNHYTLVRDNKFDKHWFRAVELWRTGKN